MPRKLSEQVVVITGASSGIGRQTALDFGARGASVVLAARNETALHDVAQQIERTGGSAHVVPTDVSDPAQVERLGQEAVNRFGRIDTWVNNAAISAYATVEEMLPEEVSRIIDVNLKGQIYGCRVAIQHMRRQGQGCIINVASALAKRSILLQATYSASKHGIKGFTEALRLEMEREHTGIDVTLIMPASTNTPLFRHARSKLGVMPRPIPPVYEPSVVSEAILYAAEHPRRDVVIGAGKMLTFMERMSPPLVDRYMLQGDRAYKQQVTNSPDDGLDNFDRPIEGTGSVTGDFGNESKSSSLYTRVLELHPTRKRALWAIVAIGALALARRAGR
jgi:short-subunit dehydrogenase